MKKKIALCLLLIYWMPVVTQAWGFFGHRRINRLAVMTLPKEMFSFYKHHIQYITESAINPDARRYAVEGEAPKHYIDIDVYGDSAVYKMPRRWKDAVAKYSEDTLKAYGIAPWNVVWMKYRLTEAFKKKDVRNILRLSAEIGHYIADSNVPLHTTENYNGQLTGQYGIHGFWESRLPEAYSDEYNYFVGQASYVSNPLDRAWNAVTNAHLALDSVLTFERELTKKFGEDKKYTYETRNGINIKTYSRDFSRAFHKALSGQVERQMRASILMIGDFWYTCWVDAGQPDLNALLEDSPSKEELDKKEKEELEALKKSDKKVKTRSHEGQ